MKNCLIFGSGRSGTSMATGMLHGSGYFQGDNYIQARASNPKGFFEDSAVNRINEDIIEYNLRRRLSYRVKCWLGRGIPPNAHWLATPPADLSLKMPPAVAGRIRERLSHAPFCYKDPRFCYTLPVWRPLLPADTRFLVVFRSPEATVRSILREWEETDYFSSMKLDTGKAVECWRCSYQRLLCDAEDQRQYFFAHYDRLVDGTCWRGLAAFLETRIDVGFPDLSIGRTKPAPVQSTLGREQATYERLLELERASLVNWSGRSAAA